MLLTKKILIMVLALAMVLQFSGCNNNAEKTETNATTLTGSLISEEPITLKAFYPASKDDDGRWGIFKEVAKRTNVSIDAALSRSNSSFAQAFNLMLASGDVPDLVQCMDPMAFSQHGIDGAFVPLNEYFDECAPNFKKLLEENPEIRKRITASDGNIYYFPHIPGGSVSTGWFIRTDWLKKLGMEIPKSAEELYEVYKAFRENDPNGNGKQDEIPYFGSGVAPLFTLWNARPDWYIDEGSIKYGPYENEYKEAVINIAKWYKEGLIDREILGRTGDITAIMLTDNIGGSTNEWFGSTSRYNETLKDAIPEFEFMPIAPPSGVELGRRPISSLYGWGVSSTSKYIKEAVKYMDFWYGEEGSRLMNFGVEGVHYDLVDGKPQFKPELLADPDFKTNLVRFGVQMDIGFRQDFEYEKQWINEYAINGQEMYANSDFIVEQVPPVEMMFTPDERKEYASMATQIDTYAKESLSKWVLGTEVLDDAAWESYISQLKKFNIERMLELKNNAYKKYNN